MSQVSEIKCPSCRKWGKWTGKMDERCEHCHEHLEAGRLHYAEEIKINTEKNRKNSYLIIKENEDPLVKMFKEFVNWLRWSTFYGISAIYFVIAFMIIVYGCLFLI
jgi:hypothetical protein